MLKDKQIIKEAIRNLKVQTRRKELKKKERVDKFWVLKIILISFVVAFLFAVISELVIPNANIVVGLILLIVFILLGILFDMIGVAVTSADEKPFHSMASRKVRGADIAVTFKKNADKVSSFCNDVIGDICGVVSGSVGVIIATSLSDNMNVNPVLMSLVVTALIAAITIGGKAIGKSFAINKNNIILYEFAKTISYFYKKRK